MATMSQDRRPDAMRSVGGDVPLERPRQRETSIEAHVVRMASLTMNFADLDRLVAMIQRGTNAEFWASPGELALALEFADAVESLR